MDRNKFSPPMIGGSSLLVIFAVLCLSVFALLSLGTVQADERLNDASVRAVTQYYEADLMAEKIFAQLRAGGEGKETLPPDALPEGVRVEGNLYSYQCPISQTQVLEVQVQKNGDRWTVLTWQARTCE